MEYPLHAIDVKKSVQQTEVQHLKTAVWAFEIGGCEKITSTNEGSTFEIGSLAFGNGSST